MMDIRQQISRSWKQYTIMHLNRRVASIHSNGTFYLLKDGDEKEVDAELLASRIARCFDVDQVLYE